MIVLIDEIGQWKIFLCDGFVIDKLDLFTFTASNGASHIYLIGDTVFIILFRENTIDLKISHSDIAQTWHFIFDQLQKKA